MATCATPQNRGKKRRGWRIPVSMPKDWKAAAELRERLGPRAAYRSLAEWPTPSEAEQEQLKRDFKEATPGELRAFRLRHGIPRDWTILKVWSNWKVRSRAETVSAELKAVRCEDGSSRASKQKNASPFDTRKKPVMLRVTIKNNYPLLSPPSDP